jgi:hypothetical protein
VICLHTSRTLIRFVHNFKVTIAQYLAKVSKEAIILLLKAKVGVWEEGVTHHPDLCETNRFVVGEADKSVDEDRWCISCMCWLIPSIAKLGGGMCKSCWETTPGGSLEIEGCLEQKHLSFEGDESPASIEGAAHIIGGTGFEHPKLFYCYCCIKLMLMIRLKVCEVCDIYALGYELRVE